MANLDVQSHEEVVEAQDAQEFLNTIQAESHLLKTYKRHRSLLLFFLSITIGIAGIEGAGLRKLYLDDQKQIKHLERKNMELEEKNKKLEARLPTSDECSNIFFAFQDRQEALERFNSLSKTMKICVPDPSERNAGLRDIATNCEQAGFPFNFQKLADLEARTLKSVCPSTIAQ